jgi:hypothetical protein
MKKNLKLEEMFFCNGKKDNILFPSFTVKLYKREILMTTPPPPKSIVKQPNVACKREMIFYKVLYVPYVTVEAALRR